MAAARRNRYEDFAAGDRGVAYLESIAQYCRAHGAALWLVSTPLRPSYRAAVSTAQEADMQQRLARFLRRHPQVRYLDFRAHPAFLPQDFFDADHLSLSGAQKFSDLLRSYLEKDN